MKGGREGSWFVLRSRPRVSELAWVGLGRVEGKRLNSVTARDGREGREGEGRERGFGSREGKCDCRVLWLTGTADPRTTRQRQLRKEIGLWLGDSQRYWGSWQV